FGAPANVPVVVRLHGSATYFAHELKRKRQPLIRWLEHRTLEQADLIISVSQYTAEVTQKIFGLKAKPFHVVYNAIDTELFAPAPAEQVDRSLILFVNSI